MTSTDGGITEAMVFVDWRDLPADVKAHLDQIEDFVGDVDGIDTTTGDVVDASDAVRAVNALVPILRSALAAQKGEGVREGLPELLRVIDKRDAEYDLFNCPSGGWIRQQLKAALSSPFSAAWNEAVEEMRELLTAAKAMLLSVGVPRRNIDDVNMVLAFYKRIDRALTRPDPTPEGR